MAASLLEPQSPTQTMFVEFDDASATKIKCDLKTHEALIVPAVKNQDRALSFTTADENAAIVVLDGHGRGNVVNHLHTNINWKNALTLPDPIKSIRHDLDRAIQDQRNDGSTFASVEALSDGFRCRWMGDTEIAIYCNGTLQWRSTMHNTANEKEKERLLQLGVKLHNSYGLKMIDATTITMEKTHYCAWSEGDACNITRVFGHSGHAKSSNEEIRVVKFNKSGLWRAVAFTDGVGDVISDVDIEWIGKSYIFASAIAARASSRWLQKWHYRHPSSCECKFCQEHRAVHGATSLYTEPSMERIAAASGAGGNPADDIGIAMIDIQVTL